MKSSLIKIYPSPSVCLKMSIKIYDGNPPESWETVFLESEDEFKEIETTLNGHMKKNNYRDIYPKVENLFKPFFLCKSQKVRVVVFSKEPYDGLCQCGLHEKATGLALSLNKCDVVPYTLQNIFKDLKIHPEHGNLDHWAENGFLFLNGSFTKRPGYSGQHMALWHGFIKKVITYLDKINPKCIYVMPGRETHFIEDFLSNASIKIKSFSFKEPLFSKINDFLDKKINWENI